MNRVVRLSFSLCFVFVLLFGLAPRLTAQAQTANISGVVTDPGGAAIFAARVRAEALPLSPGRAEDTSSSHPAREVSTRDGHFAMALDPGRYRIVISHASFARAQQEITVLAGETRELRIRMTLEPLSANVIVTAQAIPLDAESSSAPVTILTREQIERRGSTSLPDLLVTLPGFSLGRNNAEGGLTSLFLDGGNSTYTQVLVDGVEVNEPGGIVDFSNFTVDNIEKIEVVHGAESALYGSDAMTGVIQIFTRRGVTRQPELTAFAEGGNFSTGRGGVELSGLLGRFDYAAAFADLQTQGQGPNDSFRNRTMSGNFGWRFSDTSHVSLSLRDSNSAAGVPGPTLLVPANLTDHTALHNFSARLHAEFTSGSHWRHELTAAQSYNREFDFDPFFQTFLQYNRASAKAQSTYFTAHLSATAGYEYEVENGFISFIGLHARRNNQGGFVDLRWQPFARLTFNAGGRAEDNANFGTRVMPRAGAAYTLRLAKGFFGDTRLRASYGQGIKEPRFDQSFGTDPCFPGNPHLRPEQSRTVHAGVEQKLAADRVRLTADYFDNRFRNIISFQAVTSSLPACALFGAGSYFNTNLARARGANLAGEARLTHWLTATANYTYDSTRVLDAPNLFDPNYVPGSRLLRRPVHSGNLLVNAAFRRMNLSVNGYFTGKRADSDFLGLGLTSNPGYARFDLYASYRVGRGLSFYARIANLAGKQYQDVLGFPALGREFRAGVKYTTRHE